MTDFIFRIQPNIMLGTHIISRVGQSILDYGSKFMLLCDPVLRDVDLIDKVVDSLEEKQISLFVFDEIPSSATSEALEQALSLARGAYVDGIITLGGIKTASLGRSVAALYHETGLLYDYLDGKPATTDPLPFFSIMTTCRDPFLFTEFTPVIDGRNRQIKLLKIKSGFTKIVFSDPNLFGTLPKNTSISILMDTLSLAIEAYISTKSNFFSDTVLEKSIELLTQSLDATLALSSVASPATLAAQGGILAALGCGMTSPGASTALALSVNARYKISKSLVSTIMLPYLLEDSINSRVEKLDRIFERFYRCDESRNEKGSGIGLSVVKWTNLKSDNTAGQNVSWPDTDIPLFRLAEAYLTRAEAKYRLSGNPNDARADIQELHNRANADAVPANIDEMYILDEWCREFFMEGRRRSDLVRFDCFTGNKYVWDWKGGAENGISVDPHFNVYPIPAQHTLEAGNGNLTQNDGY